MVENLKIIFDIKSGFYGSFHKPYCIGVYVFKYI